MNVISADAGAHPKDGRTIQSVTRALDILEVLSTSEGEMPLNEIARMTGLNVSTCHHILLTLLTRGYVGQAQKGRSYPLVRRSSSFLQIGPASSVWWTWRCRPSGS